MPVKEHKRVERRTDVKVYAHGWLRGTGSVLVGSASGEDTKVIFVVTVSLWLGRPRGVFYR